MTGGFVHTYSPIAEMLFEQLEIKREDLITRDSELVDIISKVNAGNNVSTGDMQALVAKLAENQDLLTKVLMSQKLPMVEAVPEIEVESGVTFAMGDTVTLKMGGYVDGKIVGKPGGRLTVEWENGEKSTVNKDEVLRVVQG
jgi:hypothetical protein